MKKLLLIIATLSICILRLNAQINLEHTFDGYLMPIIIDDNPEYYYDVYDSQIISRYMIKILIYTKT